MPVAAYRIYRDHHPENLIGEIPGRCLSYEDHNRKEWQANTYYIVSVGECGETSEPAVVKIKGKKCRL
jgi:hypothetical protein